MKSEFIPYGGKENRILWVSKERIKDYEKIYHTILDSIDTQSLGILYDFRGAEWFVTRKANEIDELIFNQMESERVLE